MLITGGSGSGKTNALLNLIREQDMMHLLTRFIYMLKTLMKQNINYETKNGKKRECI